MLLRLMLRIRRTKSSGSRIYWRSSIARSECRAGRRMARERTRRLACYQ